MSCEKKKEGRKDRWTCKKKNLKNGYFDPTRGRRERESDESISRGNEASRIEEKKLGNKRRKKDCYLYIKVVQTF